MTGQSKVDPTGGAMAKGLQRWYEDMLTFGGEAKEFFMKIPWYSYVIAVIGKVTKADKAVSLHMKRSPVFTAFSSHLHAIAGVVYVVFAFGVLAHQLMGATGSSRMVKTGVLVDQAFNYLKTRLESMDTWVQQLDDMVLSLGKLAIDKDVSGMIILLWKFRFSVQQCRLDIDECLKKLDKTIPEVEKCIAELESGKQWTSTVSGIFGTVAAAGLVVPGVGWIIAGACAAQLIIRSSKADADDEHLNHFVAFLARSQCIVSDLARVKVRLDSHEEAANWLLQQESKLASLVEAEDASRDFGFQRSCISYVFQRNSSNTYISEVVPILCSLLFLCFWLLLR